MTTQLAKIVAPAITDPAYMSGINNAFDIINENFKKLASLPFVQGVQGDSYTTVIKNIWDTRTGSITEDGAILLNSIFNLSGNNEIKTNDLFSTVKTKIGNMLNTTSPIDFFVDENQNIVHNELYFYAVIDDTGNEGQKELGQYYYFVDGRLKELGNAYYNEKVSETFTDYTGFYRYIPANGTEDEHYEKIEILPTLYYDSDRNDICWKFNGVNTGISAVGVSGKDGKSKPIKFVMLEYSDTTNGVQTQAAYTLKIKAIFDSNSQNGWINNNDPQFAALCKDIDKGDTVIAQYTFSENPPTGTPGVAFVVGVVTNKTNVVDIDVTYSANSIITSDIADSLINDYLQNITSGTPRTNIRDFLGIDRDANGVITKIKPNSGNITIVREDENGASKADDKTLTLNGYKLNCINDGKKIVLKPNDRYPIEFSNTTGTVFSIGNKGDINAKGQANINDGNCQIISVPTANDEFIQLKTTNSNAVCRIKHHVTPYNEAVTLLCSDVEGVADSQYLDLYPGPTGSFADSIIDDKTTTYFGEARTGIRLYHIGKNGDRGIYGIQTRGPIELLNNGSENDIKFNTRLKVNGFTEMISPNAGPNTGKALNVLGEIKVSQKTTNTNALDISGDVSFSNFKFTSPDIYIPQIKGKYFTNSSFIFFDSDNSQNWNTYYCSNIENIRVGALASNHHVSFPKYGSSFIMFGSIKEDRYIAFSSSKYQKDSVVFIASTPTFYTTATVCLCADSYVYSGERVIKTHAIGKDFVVMVFLGNETFNIYTQSGTVIECIKVIRFERLTT